MRKKGRTRKGSYRGGFARSTSARGQVGCETRDAGKSEPGKGREKASGSERKKWTEKEKEGRVRLICNKRKRIGDQ